MSHNAFSLKHISFTRAMTEKSYTTLLNRYLLTQFICSTLSSTVVIDFIYKHLPMYLTFEQEGAPGYFDTGAG